MLYRSSSRSTNQWLSWLAPWRRIDWLLLILVVGMTIFSGLMIRTTQVNDAADDGLQQWIMGGVGLVIAMFLARWRYEILMQWQWIIYGITNVALIFVILIGVTANGAQSWINIGGFNIQPSEFAKMGLIITLAAMLHKRDSSSLVQMLKVLGVTGVSWVLVMLQPDLGTSLVFGAITLGMLFWANANPGWLLLLLSPLVSAILFNVYFPAWIFWAVAMTVIAWFTLPLRFISAIGAFLVNLISGKLGEALWGLLKEYQKDRLTLFLHPEKDPLGGGYHLIQSRIAIGSGETWGRGLYQGTQTQLNFVPEQHTDFIFSAVGEQFGFVGSMVVLVVFWLICLRLIYIACTAKENFGSLLAVGVLSMIAFQTVINICMTVGLAPITGIPLPFLSYGRSSLLTNFIAIGILESVVNYRPLKRP